MSPILVVTAVLAVAGWLVHRATWTPTDALLREEARKRSPTGLDAVRVGTFVRVDAKVVGPADGTTWLRSGVTGTSCVAWSVTASPALPLEAAVDFVVEANGAHARVVGRALQLEIDGARFPSTDRRLLAALDGRGADGRVEVGVERVLRAGARVTIIAYAAGREDDPDRVRDGDDYRARARATRVVLRGRGASALVLTQRDVAGG